MTQKSSSSGTNAWIQQSFVWSLVCQFNYDKLNLSFADYILEDQWQAIFDYFFNWISFYKAILILILNVLQC